MKKDLSDSKNITNTDIILYITRFHIIWAWNDKLFYEIQSDFNIKEIVELST